jgi:hypothetical protein
VLLGHATDPLVRLDTHGAGIKPQSQHRRNSRIDILTAIQPGRHIRQDPRRVTANQEQESGFRDKYLIVIQQSNAMLRIRISASKLNIEWIQTSRQQSNS